RARDAYLADLRQQAAEQVHIVRMGLLASGAAHELGTPLATLAVILSDWKRMPVFSEDPELAEDIAEMRAEVERCKTIVSGILMSAGEARGEAPVRSTVGRFFGEVVADWRAKSSAVAVQLTTDGSEGTPIVADPALKQVFSALLDNAAEAGAIHVG